eukprot:CAMPEP_0195510398 /NCGR_PEP_ID=MMETSP0794_2-20130614/3052_1 /TAXON_ID=515487 /ORGANISM="Stephanopyxis turris, Strain CCMP 815" /LENGTH=194 /DNA_ID=CAMNT_0040637809 /DNA_START=91 /DNA_END=675 /DNA_ORIENTATION=+
MISDVCDCANTVHFETNLPDLYDAPMLSGTDDNFLDALSGISNDEIMDDNFKVWFDNLDDEEVVVGDGSTTKQDPNDDLHLSTKKERPNDIDHIRTNPTMKQQKERTLTTFTPPLQTLNERKNTSSDRRFSTGSEQTPLSEERISTGRDQSSSKSQDVNYVARMERLASSMRKSQISRILLAQTSILGKELYSG